MSDLTQKEKELFDISLCNVETYMEIIDNLEYYRGDGDSEAIEVFSELKNQMERQCDMVAIKRVINGSVPRPIATPTPKKYTMIGLETYEIIDNPNGTKSLTLPEPESKPPKIPDPEPECMRMLRLNEQKRGEKRK